MKCNIILVYLNVCRSQCPRSLRRRFPAACLLRSLVWISPGAWIFVCCECRVLSGRGLCDELITRPEESYRLWCVVVCDLKISRMKRPWPALGRSATTKKEKPYGGCNRKLTNVIRLTQNKKDILTGKQISLADFRKSSNTVLNLSDSLINSLSTVRIS